jgi:hypothetical protein
MKRKICSEESKSCANARNILQDARSFLSDQAEGFPGRNIPPGGTMENARKYYGLSEKSPLLSVPASLRIRCHRSECLGSSECVNWRFCGPASPFGSYLAHLPSTFVGGCEKAPQAPSIPA